MVVTYQRCSANHLWVVAGTFEALDLLPHTLTSPLGLLVVYDRPQPQDIAIRNKGPVEKLPRALSAVLRLPLAHPRPVPVRMALRPVVTLRDALCPCCGCWARQ